MPHFPRRQYWGITKWLPIIDNGQVRIWCVTNNMIHLTMVWQDRPPSKRFFSKMVRGVLLMCSTKWYLARPHYKEQDEAGDTLNHTFTFPNWPSCETHWWYWRGTYDMNERPSRSAIFEYHRPSAKYGPPETHYFYPDPHPEVDSVDGYTWRRITTGETWAALRAGPGNWKFDDITNISPFEIRCHSTQFKYVTIGRAIIVFDTSSIPIGSLILSATLTLDGATRQNGFPYNTFAVNAYGATPASDTGLVFADHSEVGIIPFCDTPIWYADWNVGVVYTPNNFFFNQAGLDAIVPGQKTRIGLRNSNYDAENNPPSWYANKGCWLTCGSAESAPPRQPPRLEVIFQPPT